MKVIKNRDILLFSELTFIELNTYFEENEIREIFQMFFRLGVLEKVPIYDSDYLESRKISVEKNIHKADALHATLTKNNTAILVTRDKHFLELVEIISVKKPEDLI